MSYDLPTTQKNGGSDLCAPIKRNVDNSLSTFRVLGQTLILRQGMPTLQRASIRNYLLSIIPYAAKLWNVFRIAANAMVYNMLDKSIFLFIFLFMLQFIQFFLLLNLPTQFLFGRKIEFIFTGK